MSTALFLRGMMRCLRGRGASAAEWIVIVAMVLGAVMGGFVLFAKATNQSVGCAGSRLGELAGIGGKTAACSGAVASNAPSPSGSSNAKSFTTQSNQGGFICDAMGCRAATTCTGPGCADGVSCFARGTAVETSSGPRAIEDVQPGALVLARDPESGVTSLRPVVATKVTFDRETVRVDLGTESIVATPEHPFFVSGRGFVAAGALAANDVVVTSDGTATVRSVSGSEKTSVYNLEVEGFHTYFVGQAHAWVHNACNIASNDMGQPAVVVAPTQPYVPGPVMDGLARMPAGVKTDLQSNNPFRQQAAVDFLVNRAKGGDAAAFIALTREVGMIAPGLNPQAMKKAIGDATDGFLGAPSTPERPRALLAAAANPDAQVKVLGALADSAEKGEKPTLDLLANAVKMGFSGEAIVPYLLLAKDKLDASHYSAIATAAFENRNDNTARRALKSAIKGLKPGAWKALEEFEKATRPKADAWKTKAAKDFGDDLDDDAKRDDNFYVKTLEDLGAKAKGGDLDAKKQLEKIRDLPAEIGNWGPWPTGKKAFADNHQALADRLLRAVDGPKSGKDVDARIAKAETDGPTFDALAVDAASGKIDPNAVVDLFSRNIDRLGDTHYRAVSLAAFGGDGNDKAKDLLDRAVREFRPGAWSAIDRFGASREMRPVKQFEVTRALDFGRFMVSQATSDWSFYDKAIERLTVEANRGSDDARRMLSDIAYRGSNITKYGPNGNGGKTGNLFFDLLQDRAQSGLLRLRDDVVDVDTIDKMKAAARTQTGPDKKIAENTLKWLEKADKRNGLRSEMLKAGGAIGFDDDKRLSRVRYPGGGGYDIGYDDKGAKSLTVYPTTPGEGITWTRDGDTWTAGTRKFTGTVTTDEDGNVSIETDTEKRTRRRDGTEVVVDKATKLTRELSLDGRVLAVEMNGKRATFEYKGKELVGIDNKITGTKWERKDDAWVVGGRYYRGTPKIGPYGIELVQPARTETDTTTKYLTIRNPNNNYPTPFLMRQFNSPEGPQLIDAIQQSTWKVPGKDKEISGRELLSYGNRELWPGIWDGTVRATKGPLMGISNFWNVPERMRDARWNQGRDAFLMQKKNAEDDVKHLNHEISGFIRNVEVSGERYGVSKLDADEHRAFPPDYAQTSDGRTFKWGETKTVSEAPFRVESFVDGKSTAGKFTFDAASGEAIYARYQAEMLTGQIPKSMSFPAFVTKHQDEERAKYKELLSIVDSLSVYRGDKGPQQLLEVLRQRKKNDPAFIVRNLYALIPNSPVLKVEKDMATEIKNRTTDIRQEIGRRLQMVDDQKFAELAKLEAKVIDLQPLGNDVRTYKDFGAIPALNLPPDHPDYQAFWRGVLTPVNGMISSFNYEDDPLGPVLPLTILAMTIAAPEVMVPAMIAIGTPEIAINVGDGISKYRDATTKLEKAQKSGDKAAIREATIERNKAIEKITAATSEFVLLIAPIAIDKAAGLVRAGKPSEAVTVLRQALRAEGRSLNDIEFTLSRMKVEIEKLPEGPGRSLAEKIYRNQLETFDALASLEKGQFLKSAYKAKAGKPGAALEFDEAILPKKGQNGKPGGEPVKLEPKDLVPAKETTGPPAPREPPTVGPDGKKQPTRQSNKPEEVPHNHNWPVVQPASDPAIALRVDRFHEQLSIAKKLYDQGKFEEAIAVLRQESFLRKSNIVLKDGDVPRVIEIDTKSPLSAADVERHYSPASWSNPPGAQGGASEVVMHGHRYQFVEKGTGRPIDLNHPSMRELGRDQFWNHVEELKHAISQQSPNVATERVVVSKTYARLLRENPKMPYNEEVDVMFLRTQDMKDFAPEAWMMRYEDRLAFVKLYGDKLPRPVMEALTEGGKYSLGPAEAKWWPALYDETAARGVLDPRPTRGVGEMRGDPPSGSKRPMDGMERFPKAGEVDAALKKYAENPGAARAQDPMSVPKFLGQDVQSANMGSLRVELLKNGDGPPIAVLHSKFHGGDAYWNDRYKDVALFHLFEKAGLKDVFAEAVHVPNEGAAVIRWWTDYRPLAKGAPQGLEGAALDAELARVSISTYVSGNVDGAFHNPNNGGFAKFLDPKTGQEYWRGVVIDSGAAFNPMKPGAAPWNGDLLGRGPVKRDAIPKDVVDGLTKIAEGSAKDLSDWAGFPAADEGALSKVRPLRERAQEVLDHYGIPYKKPGGAPVPPKAPRPVDGTAKYPSKADIDAAMALYAKDPKAARMNEPMTVGEFLGKKNNSANDANLRVEMLRPYPGYKGEPIAFLHSRFHGGDAYWNNRYKDVQLAQMFKEVGLEGTFAEAAHIPHEGAALVRWWTGYKPVADAPPLSGVALREEVARASLLSYVAGDADGLMHNANNGGFALFKDASGKEYYRGVVIDSGAAWNTPPVKPWESDVMGLGSVARKSIPDDVVAGLVKIAEASPEQLATWSKFPKLDEGALQIVEAQRARAREILDQYKIHWEEGRRTKTP